jgi:hypothetical protein
LLWRSLLARRAINDRVIPQDPFFDPTDACSPDCRVFLSPREVGLKNYVFRTGLNWRFDWGKAPVAVGIDRSKRTRQFISRAVLEEPRG